MTADVVTFGCRLNITESEAIRRAASALEDAVVVNTCAVTAEAVRQARQTIRRIKRERPSARIAVTGCAAQTEPGTFAAMPEVDRVIGNEEKLDPRTWTRSWSDDSPRIAVGDIMAMQRHAAQAAPFCKCRTAAITAARSASFRSGAAIRASSRWTSVWRERAGWPRAAIANWC